MMMNRFIEKQMYSADTFHDGDETADICTPASNFDFAQSLCKLLIYPQETALM